MEEYPLEHQLIEGLSTMPRQLGAAARFVLENPKEVALMSMREQARRVGVSHTTMVRLATWLGLNSYEELRAFHARSLRAPGNEPAANGFAKSNGSENRNPAASRVASVFAAQAASLGGADNAQQLIAIAAVLANSRQVFCLGWRSAHTIARHFTQLISHLDVQVTLLDTATGSGLNALRRAGSQDALLAISFAPYASVTIDLVQRALRSDVAVVAITDSKVSSLVRLARESIVVSTRSYSYFRSIAPALSATEILASLMADRIGIDFDNVKLKERHFLD